MKAKRAIFFALTIGCFLDTSHGLENTAKVSPAEIEGKSVPPEIKKCAEETSYEDCLQMHWGDKREPSSVEEGAYINGEDILKKQKQKQEKKEKDK